MYLESFKHTRQPCVEQLFCLLIFCLISPQRTVGSNIDPATTYIHIRVCQTIEVTSKTEKFQWATTFFH